MQSIGRNLEVIIGENCLKYLVMILMMHTLANSNFSNERKRSTDPSRIFYDWPTQEDIEIIDAGRCFWGPTKPDSVKYWERKNITKV